MMQTFPNFITPSQILFAVEWGLRSIGSHGFWTVFAFSGFDFTLDFICTFADLLSIVAAEERLIVDFSDRPSRAAK